ncbi:MAG: hypothetical protein OXM58_01690 [Rhodospirillaceae bacterium]|nr:hypothetical protein [Rhodospirillaceae bacterium]MDE0618679.1 hypothetical protein [Rhodospirillaceae bacterium]
MAKTDTGDARPALCRGPFRRADVCRTAQVGNIIYYWPEVQKIKQFLKQTRAFP